MKKKLDGSRTCPSPILRPSRPSISLVQLVGT
jgi:hypothetical protein